MCTLTYLPRGKGYLLGHNRDESVTRARGSPPERQARGRRRFLAPRDLQAGGTWIGVNDAGVTMCVLNAAEADPSRLPAVPLSRGRVLWDLLHHTTIDAASAGLDSLRRDLASVRSFHLVAVEPWGPRAARFRWDGSDLARDDHEGPALFVSSGYDQAGAEFARGVVWRRFLQDHPSPSEESLAAFLASHEPERGALSPCMHRVEASTVSRTIVSVSGRTARMIHHDGPPCESPGVELRSSLTLL